MYMALKANLSLLHLTICNLAEFSEVQLYFSSPCLKIHEQYLYHEGRMLLHTCWEACRNSYVLLLFIAVSMWFGQWHYRHISTAPVTKQRWAKMLWLLLQLHTLEHTAMTSVQKILTYCPCIFPGMFYSKSWHLCYAHINRDDTHG